MELYLFFYYGRYQPPGKVLGGDIPAIKKPAQKIVENTHLLSASVVQEQAACQDKGAAAAHHYRAAFSLWIVVHGRAGDAVLHGAAVKLYRRWPGQAREYDRATLPQKSK